MLSLSLDYLLLSQSLRHEELKHFNQPKSTFTEFRTSEANVQMKAESIS